MPYIILNDKRKPWRYFTTEAVGISAPQSIDEASAHRFPTLTPAADVMHQRADLYNLGWRVAYVKS